MKALVLERNVARFAAHGVMSHGVRFRPRGLGRARFGSLDTEPPELPGPDWRRVQVLLAGICGSDLATLDGHSSRYFEDLVSFPFVPGHEIVGLVSQDAADGSAATPDAGAAASRPTDGLSSNLRSDASHVGSLHCVRPAPKAEPVDASVSHSGTSLRAFRSGTAQTPEVVGPLPVSSRTNRSFTPCPMRSPTKKQ